jgi:hypothetical protein
MLNIVDPNKDFLVCTYASKEGLGGFLIQGHVIFCESKKLNEHEINYVTHDLVLDSIVHSLKMWRNYLLCRRFILMTDHSGLRYFFDEPKLNSRQDRWMVLLSEFDFEIKHIKGKENTMVGSLSISMKVIHLEVVRTYESEVKKRVKSAQETYAFSNIMKSYLEQHPRRMKYEDYQLLNDDMLTYEGRLYIPNCNDLRRFIMDELHKIPYTGYLGFQKMIITTTKIFYWPRLKKEIADHIDKCL